MHRVTGYHISEQLYESANSLVFRAVRESDQFPVILKLLKDMYPSPARIAWFQREFEVTRTLNIAGIPLAYTLEQDRDRWLMVLEDFGGDSLSRLKLAGVLDLDRFLTLAITITDILGQIHQRHIMHKDINPANIVYNPTTGQVKIIDFGISTVLSREKPTFRNPNVLEGTLAYMSPEQTGRMNRAMDYRTDFYSLGVTFYELLTGQLPFDSKDALGLVHHHIARQPRPPHELCPTIPEELSLVILKLMTKNAEDRYQSAYGIKYDLEWIGQTLAEEPEGRDQASYSTAAVLSCAFMPGQHDISDRFLIPQKLYGREREIDALLTAFDRVTQGTGEVVLMAGAAGIGKTALAQELYAPITRQRGYVITGRFEQLQRDIPYTALIQAFRSLMQYVLIENDTEIASWREKLTQAIGSNGRILIEVIPEIELIIGPQPDVPMLGPTESQNRFNLIFARFIQVFTQPEHPLVIFLDDMQWADRASLTLIEQFLATANNRYLLLIGTYRNNEVERNHPLWSTIRIIQDAGIQVSTLSLEALDSPAVTRLIAETFHCTRERVAPLAELVVGKTNGNPFFLQEFLTSLYVDALIDFDYDNGQWNWGLEQIQAQEMTDNVIDLLTRKLQRLEQPAQDVLKLAACIGTQFDLVKLAVVAQKPVSETARLLESPIIEGLVIPLGDAYQLMTLDVPGLADAVTAEYLFAHSRIHQAVYSLIPNEERQLVHWRIGNLLLLDIQPAKREEHIFDIVNQLNQGRAFLFDQEESDELVHLNLLAGKRAKLSAAFVPAYHYLTIGLELLQDKNKAPLIPFHVENLLSDEAHDTTRIYAVEPYWQRQYDLCLDLYTEATEVAYLTGAFDDMERLAAAVLRQSKRTLDTIKIYEVKIRAYIAQGAHIDAVQTALHALKMLGIHFHEKPDKLDSLAGLHEVQTALAGKELDDLLNLPEITDPLRLAAMRILTSATNAAYLSSPELMSLITFKMVNLSVTYGYTPISAHAYASYGLILCGDIGDIESGYRFGQLALHLLERFNASELKPRTMMVVNTFIRHWKEHVRDTLPSLLEAYQIGMDIGDFEFAAIAVYVYSSLSFFAGKHLDQLEQEMAAYNDLLYRIRQQRARAMNGLYHQVVLNLLGKSKVPHLLAGESYNEDLMLPMHMAARDKTAIYYTHLNKLILCYMFRAYEEALTHAGMVETYARSAVASYSTALFHFYDSLNRLALLRLSSATSSPLHQIVAEQNTPLHRSLPDAYHLRKIAANQEKLRSWARHAPMNHLHKWHLVEAERARMDEQDKDARDHYDRAIDLAREHGYINEEALACELAAGFYFHRRRPRISHAYLQDAYYAYERWGARAKVRDLEHRFPEFFGKNDVPSEKTRITTSVTQTEEREPSVLDLASVIKASQAIFGEIVLEPLLAKLMHIFIENAGAERGVLLLYKAGQWVVEAEHHIDNKSSVSLQSVAMEQAALPASIINYAGHLQESVILHDASREQRFAQDSYIQQYLPASVLCMPMIYQKELIGILYLENNLTPGAFTEDRVEILNLLANQAAISIVHARLYRHMEDIVEARTIQLSRTNATLQAEVAERKRAQEALVRAKDAAEAASRTKSTFLANMSHELRTPLNTILGFTQLMSRGGAVSAEQKEYLSIIHRSGRHLLTLINDVLDLSKIEAGRMILNETVFDLHHLLNDMDAMFSTRAREKGIALIVERTPAVPPIIHTDELKLRQVLINLLSNAIKFTHQGRVTLSVECVTHTGKNRMQPAEDTALFAQRATLYFTVSDTGIGIAPDEIGTIFEAFVQTRGGQQSLEGTGLGLAISYKFVQLLGGSITVHSQVHQGSVFAFDIPVGIIEASRYTLAPEEPLIIGLAPDQTTHRILVVDDTPEHRSILVNLQAPLGFELREASNGHEMFTICETWHPNLIWMNHPLPDMESIEAVQRIKATDTGIPPIIIAMTTDTSENRNQLLLAGFDDVLCKPFCDNDLFDALSKHLGLCYIYAHDTNEAATETTLLPPARDNQLLSSMLATLPAALVSQLYHTAILGDISAMMLLIERVRTHNPELADEIAFLVKEFRYEQLAEAAESLVPDTP